eukprot:394711-Pleurochrysis_carterae.AAC.1
MCIRDRRACVLACGRAYVRAGVRAGVRADVRECVRVREHARCTCSSRLHVVEIELEAAYARPVDLLQELQRDTRAGHEIA